MSPVLMGLSVLDTSSTAASVVKYTKVQVSVAGDLGFPADSALYDPGLLPWTPPRSEVRIYRPSRTKGHCPSGRRPL